MLNALLLWTLFFLSIISALPTNNLMQRTCTNHLVNPSFELKSIFPWLTIVTSAWSNRDVVASPFAHSGAYYYQAHSNSTIEATLTLFQSGLNVPANTVVECYAWVAGQRGEGSTSVEVFLDGVSCGTASLGDGDRRQWVRAGGRVRVQRGEDGIGSTIAIVASSERAGKDGWDIWIDDVGVVSC